VNIKMNTSAIKRAINGLFECFHERKTFRFTKESLHYVFI
jgi:hypothetical protein